MKYEINAISGLFRSSPTMRREWIEIDGLFVDSFTLGVSLHAEGVD